MGHQMKRLTVLVGGAALGLSLVACGGGSDSNEPSPAASAAADQQEEAPTGKVDKVPTLDEGWQGIRSDVTVDDCPTTKGDVAAVGTVKNSAKKSRDIVLVVAWNAPDTTDPLMQLTVTKKNVASGKTVKWRAQGSLPADAGQCIVVARSGKVA